MIIRIISAIVGIPIAVFIIYKGGWLITTATAVITLIGLDEFYRVFRQVDIYPFRWVGGFAAITIIASAGLYSSTAQAANEVIIISLIVCFLVMISKKKFRVVDLGVTILGIAYVPLLFSLFLVLYRMDKGPVLIWLVFVIAWMGDTAAYFTGLTAGRHKLCPPISPNKSVEGAIGGLAGSIIGAILFGMAANTWAGISFNTLSYVIVGALGGIMGQAGDLAASVIKRFAGVKDFGSIIPGHGGILDRFDSILFVLPVVYFYVRYFL